MVVARAEAILAVTAAMMATAAATAAVAVVARVVMIGMSARERMRAAHKTRRKCSGEAGPSARGNMPATSERPANRPFDHKSDAHQQPLYWTSRGEPFTGRGWRGEVQAAAQT